MGLLFRNKSLPCCAVNSPILAVQKTQNQNLFMSKVISRIKIKLFSRKENMWIGSILSPTFFRIRYASPAITRLKMIFLFRPLYGNKNARGAIEFVVLFFWAFSVDFPQIFLCRIVINNGCNSRQKEDKQKKRKETKGWKITLKQNRGKMEINLAAEIWANPAIFSQRFKYFSLVRLLTLISP